MSQSGPSDESYDDSKNPFVEVRILKKKILSFQKVLNFQRCQLGLVFILIFKIIGFQPAKTSSGDSADGTPYSLLDLTQAMTAHLQPLMVSLFLE